MFSEVQRNFIQQLVLANKKEYPYYLAYTNTNVSNNMSPDGVNFYVILSNQPITANSQYEYTISGTSVRFACKSGNASYNYHTERITTGYAPSTVRIDNYEFAYTNAEFSSIALQPDLLITSGVQQSHFDGFSIILLVLCCSVIFYNFLKGGRGVNAIGKL